MTIPDAVVVGPFAVSVSLLIPALALLVMMLGARVLLRHDPTLRSSVFDTMSSAGLLFLLGWKLAPVVGLLLREPALLIGDPILALYMPGGRPGVALGVLFVLAYAGFQYRRSAERLRAVVAPVLLVAVGAVILTAVAHLGVEIARVAVGDNQAQPLSARNLVNEEVPLYPYDGRPVVLNFWATWCGPCRAENAVKKRLHELYGQEFRLIGVNMIASESGRVAVQDYVEQWQLSFDIVLDDRGEAAAAYAIRGTPTTVFIDAHGQVVERVFGALSFGRAERILSRMLDDS